MVCKKAQRERLENDRGYAQDVLERLGLSIAATHTFCNRDEAIQFVQDRPARYVVKFNTAYETFVGELEDGRDVQAFLRGLPQQGDYESFVLMQHIEGVGSEAVGGKLGNPINIREAGSSGGHR